MSCFLPVIIDIAHNNAHFLNKINSKIPSSGVTDQLTKNPHDLCYQCSKDGPNFLFGTLSIRGSGDEPHFPAERKLLSCQIQINTLFNNNYERKRRRCDKNIHKAILIPVNIYQK